MDRSYAGKAGSCLRYPDRRRRLASSICPVFVQYLCSICAVFVQYLVAEKQYLSTSCLRVRWKDKEGEAHLRGNLSAAFTSQKILNLSFRRVAVGIDLSMIWEIGVGRGGLPAS